MAGVVMSESWYAKMNENDIKARVSELKKKLADGRMTMKDIEKMAYETFTESAGPNAHRYIMFENRRTAARRVLKEHRSKL